MFGTLCFRLGTAPIHTVTVYNRAAIKVLIYRYYEYYPTVTDLGQYPSFKVYVLRAARLGVVGCSERVLYRFPLKGSIERAL